MRTLSVTNQFKRDAKKQYLVLLTPEWAEVLHCLCQDLAIPEKYRDHQLSGNLKDLRDCHIKPDLVLLYRKHNDSVELVRLGSHSELSI